MSIDVIKPSSITFGDTNINSTSEQKFISIVNADSTKVKLTTATITASFYCRLNESDTYVQLLNINKELEVPFKDGTKYYADAYGKITTTVTNKLLGVGSSDGNLDVNIINDIYLQDNNSELILDNSGFKIRTE